MSTFTVLSIVGFVIASALLIALRRLHSRNAIDHFMHRRDGSSSASGHAELVDGSRHIPVALTLSDATLYYQNEEIDASIALSYVREIEYDSELMTGQQVEHGEVLRVRCSSQVYEFVLPIDEAARWRTELPSRVATL